MDDNNKKIDAFSIVLSKRNLNDKLYIVPNKKYYSNKYDLNNDGKINEDDLELLRNKINHGIYDKNYDLNNDGNLNQSDIDILIKYLNQNINYNNDKFKPYDRIFKLILNDLEDILNQGFILNTNKMTCINEVYKLLENHKNNKLQIVINSLLNKINTNVNINGYKSNLNNPSSSKNQLIYCVCGLNEFNIHFGDSYETSLLKTLIDNIVSKVGIDYDKTIENIMKDEQL